MIMRRPFRHTVRLAGGVALLCLLGATASCSGSSSSGAAPSSPVAAATTPSAATPSASTADADAVRFCAVVQQQKDVLAGKELSGLLAGGNPAAWKAYLGKVTAMNEQLVATAPAQIKPSVLKLQAGTQDVVKALAAAGYDPSKVGVTKLLGLIRSPDQAAATQTLVTYVGDHCGIDLTKLAG